MTTEPSPPAGTTSGASTAARRRTPAELAAAIRRDQRIVLVVNQRSRRGRAVSLRLPDRLAAAGIRPRGQLSVVSSDAMPDVMRAALDLEPDLLIAGGGDGTLATAAGLVAHRDVALGVLPLGTTNNFARSLGLPLGLRQAVAALGRGAIADVDLARVQHGEGREIVANLVSLGVSVEIAGRTPHRLKRRVGRVAYAVTALHALRGHQPFAATLTTDSTTRRLMTHQLNIANGRFHAGSPVAREASLDDRLLTVYPLGDHRRTSLVSAIVAQALLGQRRSHAQGPFLVTPRVHVATDPPLDADIDGEVRGRTPFTVLVDAKALRVVVPVRGT